MAYDIGIIGLGPAGHKMALLALKNGLSVVCFEKNFVGGTCLNVGCIPTKSILHDSEASFEKNWLEILERKNKIVEKFQKAVEKDLQNKGAVVIFAEASVEKCAEKIIIKSGEQNFEVQNLIIATGSKPQQIEGLKCDGEFLLNSNQVYNLNELPKSIAIVGSGAIGIEWARIFNNLGVETTIIEKAQALLPTSDIDVSKRLERIFKMKKIKFHLNCEIERIEKKELHLTNGQIITPDKVLIAIGRSKVEIELPNNPHIFKIGDANCGPMLAHNATAQAKMVFEHIFNGKKITEIKNSTIPTVVYGNPEIASIGEIEQNLTNKNYKVYSQQIASLPKAHCDLNTEGFVKIISDEFGKILGAHIISKEASAMIVQIAIAMKAEMSIDELKEVIFPHPTLSEGILEALENG